MVSRYSLTLLFFTCEQGGNMFCNTDPRSQGRKKGETKKRHENRNKTVSHAVERLTI